MADVFISYKAERRKAAKHLADVLRAHGYTVWYDYELAVGDDYPKQIDDELTAAKAVLVLWCSMSISSDWVNREAHAGLRGNKLIPAWIENAEPRIPFKDIQGVLLQTWDASPRSRNLDPLMRAIATVTGKKPLPDFDKQVELDETWHQWGAQSLAQFALSAPPKRPSVQEVEREVERRIQFNGQTKVETARPTDHDERATEALSDIRNYKTSPAPIIEAKLGEQTSAPKKRVNWSLPPSYVASIGAIVAIVATWLTWHPLDTKTVQGKFSLLFPAGTEFPTPKGELPSAPAVIQTAPSPLLHPPVAKVTISEPIRPTSPPLPADLKGVSQTAWARAYNGSVPDQLAIGRAYKDGLEGTAKNGRLAIGWLEKAASQNDADAMYFIGLIYLDGAPDVAVDALNAVNWLEKAAEHNHALAQNALGLLYTTGADGIPIDGKKAQTLYLKSAENGYAQAEANLGFLYRDGAAGIAINGKEAEKWLLKAALRYHAAAQNALGSMYYLGTAGIEKNGIKAVEWFEKSAAQGHVRAKSNLGFIYRDGAPGIEVDGQEAEKWFLEAATAGLAEACNGLGWMYMVGISGVEKNGKKSEEWLLKAADQKFVLAQLNLGILYEYGLPGVSKNRTKAVEFYRLAAAQNEGGALAALKRLGVKYP